MRTARRARHSFEVTGERADPGERSGTLFVLEGDPAPTRSRWFCHWDGVSVPGFDTPEEAVVWGLAHARTVIVRTLGDVFYWAGERPPDWGDPTIDLRAWPPSVSERRQIDTEYQAALAAVHEEQADRAAYERERERWLGIHAPEFVGQDPVHECLVLVPDSDNIGIYFQELAHGGAICGARCRGGGLYAFGSTEEVIAAASRRLVADPWVGAVGAALARERAWARASRRTTLVVKVGEGEMFHATAVENRQSILRHGLHWARMGAVSGIAGSHEPELHAIFLCESLAEIRFFTRMARSATDVWAVRVDGLWVENGPSGWTSIFDSIAPERLRLVAANAVKDTC